MVEISKIILSISKYAININWWLLWPSFYCNTTLEPHLYRPTPHPFNGWGAVWSELLHNTHKKSLNGHNVLPGRSIHFILADIPLLRAERKCSKIQSRTKKCWCMCSVTSYSIFDFFPFERTEGEKYSTYSSERAKNTLAEKMHFGDMHCKFFSQLLISARGRGRFHALNLCYFLYPARFFTFSNIILLRT